MATLYLYLIGRDKKGLKLITTLSGPTQRSKVENASQLKLPIKLQNDIQKIIHENRMQYECWLESASSFEEIRQLVRSRGCKNIPNTSNSLIQPTFEIQSIGNNSCKKITSMLRKNT
jgi:hypothetical protein